MFKVNLISRETIKPSRPTPEHLRYLQTSLFDHENSPILMPLVFFFSPKANVMTTNTVLDRLRGSLPETLSLFYPLAGRAKNKNYINCNDEGVYYAETKVVGACFKEVVHKAKVAQLDLFLPCDGQEGYTSLILVIQVTTFLCGGVTIGVKMSHAISDAYSLVMFVNTWSAIANYGTILHFPFFEIWKLFPPPPPKLPNDIDEQVDIEPNPQQIATRPVTRSYMFNRARLEILRSKLDGIGDNLSDDNNCTLPPSLPMVRSSFIWCRVKGARQGSTSGNFVPDEVFHAVNIRPSVSAPEKCYYFGNMVVNALAKPSMSLGDQVNANKKYYLCCDFLGQMKVSIERIKTNNGFIRNLQEGRESLRFMTDHFDRKSRGEIASLGFSNLRSLPVYEADFGWGKPVWVTLATCVYKDLVILIPAGPSNKLDDIQAYISLSSDEMAKLECDPEFLSYVTVPSASSKL